MMYGVIRRYELTDLEWDSLSRYLPSTATGGRPRGGRPPTFNKLIYRHRNVVERCFNRLKQRRSVATRYNKTSTSFHATVTIAALLQWR